MKINLQIDKMTIKMNKQRYFVVYFRYSRASWGVLGCPGVIRPTHRSSVIAIVNDLGWRTLEQRRADAGLCFFFKMVYGLVAVPLPEYIEQFNRISRYCHTMTFRQLHTSKDYYKHSFFPLAIVQWNALPETVACLPDLESFKVAVSKLQHTRP